MKNKSLTISIGNIYTRLTGGDTDLWDELQKKYLAFLAPSGQKPDCTLRVSHRSPQMISPEINVVKNDSVYTITDEEFFASIDVEKGDAQVQLRPNISVFDTFLRVLYSILGLQHQALLVHSAGLCKNGCAHIFAGPSSSGKTTSARQVESSCVLSDELTFIKKMDRSFYAFATPFCGEYKGRTSNQNSAIKNIFFLDKKLLSGYEPAGTIESLCRFLENVFFFERSQSSHQEVLRLAKELTDAIPCYSINILARPNLWRFIDEISQSCDQTKSQGCLAGSRQ